MVVVVDSYNDLTTDCLFCPTEIFAATEAGYQVVISDRPGNAPLGPESEKFKIVTSFDQIFY